MDAAEADADGPAMKLYDDKEAGAEGLEGPRGRAGRHRPRPGQARHMGRLGGLRRPARQVGDYLRDLRKLLDKYGYERASTAISARAACTPASNFDLKTASRHSSSTARFIDEAARPRRLATAARSRASTATASRGPSCCRRCSAELDRGVPRVQVDLGSRLEDEPRQGRRSLPVTENLRLGADYDPPHGRDALSAFPDDQGASRTRRRAASASASAAARTAATMCPSFLVTREEKHSTRGRARPAVRDAQGDRSGGWQDEREGARPVPLLQGLQGRLPRERRHGHYKAEFLSHYYEGRLRPRSAYAFGLIDNGPRLAPKLPRLVNFVTRRRRSAGGQAGPAASTRAHDARASHHVPLPGLFAARRGATPAASRADPLDGHVQRTTSPRSALPRSRCSRPRASRWWCPGGPVLRPAALRLRHARPREAVPRAHSRDCAMDPFAPALPSSASSPAASRC